MRRANPSLSDLRASPAQRASVLELIEKNFPTGSPTLQRISIEEEFALLLDSANAARTVFLSHENRPVSSASYRIFDLRVPGAAQPLRCAGIGLVVTEADVRGRGFARQVQTEIEQRARAEGCTLAVLWSDRADFYGRLGYLVAGTERQWHVEGSELATLRQRLRAELKPDPQLEIRPLANFAETLPLFERATTGPRRDAAVYERLLRVPNTWSLGAYRAGKLTAYALLGKGRDLRDTVHEILGDESAVGPLLAAAVQKVERRLRVQQPYGSMLEAEISHWFGSEGERTPLAFFKVLDAVQFGAWLNDASVFPRGVRVRATDQRVEVSGEGGVFFESDDPGHLIQLFLGPWLISEMEDLPELLTRHLAGSRIPPLYFWGFDSV